MNKTESVNAEIVRISKQITDACLEHLSSGKDNGDYIDRLVGKIQNLRAELREIEDADKPKPPKDVRPYTWQEAIELFGWRSYTDICRIRPFEDYWDQDEGKYRPQFDYQIDGIIFSSGHTHVRIHSEIDSDDYQYVSLERLLIDWCWPGGARCGVKIDERGLPLL